MLRPPPRLIGAEERERERESLRHIPLFSGGLFGRFPGKRTRCRSPLGENDNIPRNTVFPESPRLRPFHASGKWKSRTVLQSAPGPRGSQRTDRSQTVLSLLRAMLLAFRVSTVDNRPRGFMESSAGFRPHGMILCANPRWVCVRAGESCKELHCCMDLLPGSSMQSRRTQRG